MRRTRLATRLLLSGVASAGLAVASTGCSHTVSVGPSRTLRLAVSEYRVIPQSVRARSGQLTLLIENDGRLAHDLAISRHGKIVGQTPPIQPGGSAFLALSLTRGSYLMTSTLFSDQALGAYGTLNVTS
jgi:hypothetical protein